MSSNDNSQLQELWVKALAEYQKTTNKDLVSLSSIIKSGDDVVELVGKRHQELTEFRRREGHFVQTFSSIAGKAKNILQVVGTALGLAYPPSSAIFAAAFFMIEVSRNMAEVFEVLEVYFKKIDAFLERSQVYVSEDVPELHKTVIKVFESILIVCAKSQQYLQKTFIAKILSATKIGNGLEEATEEFDRLIDHEHFMLSAVTIKILTQIRSQTDNIAGQVNMFMRTIEGVQHSRNGIGMSFEAGEMIRIELTKGTTVSRESQTLRENKLDPKIFAILQPEWTGTQNAYTEASADLLPGFGQWLEKEENFIAWTKADSPFLWISGDIGAGQSVLACHIIRHLQSNILKSPENGHLAFFFFRYLKKDLRSHARFGPFETFLRTVAYQIAQRNPEYALYLRDIDESELQDLEDLAQKLFTDFFNSKSQSIIWIVAHGISETDSDERRRFLSLMHQYWYSDNIVSSSQVGNTVSNINRPIQLVILGHTDSEDELTDVFKQRFPMVKVQRWKVETDINNYIVRKLAESEDLQILWEQDLEIYQKIETHLCEHHGGNFLWASLMVRRVVDEAKGGHINDILEILKELPEGVMQLYEKKLADLATTLANKPGQIQDLNNLLAWVACCRQQLSLAQLKVILGLRSPVGLGSFGLDRLLQHRYASLFKLVTEEGTTCEEDREILKHLPRASSAAGEVVHLNLPSMLMYRFDPERTFVNLSSVCLGDFLMKGQANHENSMIRMNPAAANFEIAKTCLDLLCEESLFKSYGSCSITNYAARYFHDHLHASLTAKAPEELSSEARGKMSDRLLKLFTDQSVASRQVTALLSWPSVNHWEISKNQAEMFCLWFGDMRNVAATELKTQVWIEVMKKKTFTTWMEDIKQKPYNNLLELGARGAVSVWLKNSNLPALSCFQYASNFLKTVGNYPKQRPSEEEVEQTSAALEARQILFVAEWPKFLKNALWYARLAKLFREKGLFDQALFYYGKARELDDESYLTLVGLSLTFAKVNSVERALEWASKCNKLPFEDAVTDRTLKTNLATWYEIKCDISNANMVLQQAFSLSPWSFWPAPLFLRFLSRNNLVDQIPEVLKELAVQLDPNKIAKLKIEVLSASEIDNFLSDLSDNMLTNEAVRMIAWHSEGKRRKECFQLGEQVYSRSIDVARARGLRIESAAIGHQLGLLHYQSSFFDDTQTSKAMSHWEQVLKEINKIGGTRIPDWLRETVEESLSKTYLDKMFSTRQLGNDAPSASEYLSKLQALVDSDPPITERALPMPLGVQRASLFLGLYYYGQDKKAEAKRRLGSIFKVGIEMLRDSTIDHDQAAYSRLRSVLLAVRDYDNAIAAMHCSLIPAGSTGKDIISDISGDRKLNFTRPLLRFSESDQTWNIERTGASESSIGIPSETGKAYQQQLAMPYSCDGPDHTDFLTETFWTCTYCLHIDLCERCYPSFKARQLFVKTCNPKHEFLHLQPLQQVMQEGKIIVNNQIMLVTDWLDDLEMKWV